MTRWFRLFARLPCSCFRFAVLGGPLLSLQLHTTTSTMSEFGESELSDLESSNDEYTQSAAKAKAAEKKKAAAKKTAQANSIIKGALKPPRPTTYTTQALYGTFEHPYHCNPDPNCGEIDGIIHSHINLDADYQRGAFLPFFARVFFWR